MLHRSVGTSAAWAHHSGARASVMTLLPAVADYLAGRRFDVDDQTASPVRQRRLDDRIPAYGPALECL
jgi:hypothetical protein